LRFLQVFRDFRSLLDALRALVSVLADLVEAQRELGPAVERLEALELSRHHFEAEISGMVLKAEGKLKAANNSEARERQLKKSYENRIDPLDPDSQEAEEVGETVYDLDVARGEEERLQALRLDVAPNSKANALRRKWQGMR